MEAQVYIDKNCLAKRLSISISTVNNLMAQGMPYLKIGKAVRFDIKEVLQWLKERGK